MDRLRLWWLRSSDISADQVDHLLAHGANKVIMGEREIAQAMLDFAKTS